MSIYHIPVMSKEAIHYLNIQKDSWYIDCTLGGGGHTEEIIKASGRVLGIDLDADAISEVSLKHHLKIEQINNNLLALSPHLILYQTNFIHLKGVTRKFIKKPILGILFDLGVSSYQLERKERGFSFNIDAPLDMRMDPIHTTITAKDLINALHESELTQLFQKYGEERLARPIAKKIVQVRQRKKITTTNELAQIILSVRKRGRGDRTHPATRIFQALRIAVNDELHTLEASLPQALKLLAPQGRIVVISFHSLEDRIVKNFFQNEEKNGSIKILTQKPVIPTKEEVIDNPRSRSGKLRAAEKI